MLHSRILSGSTEKLKNYQRWLKNFDVISDKTIKAMADSIESFKNRPPLSFLGVKEGHIEDVKRWSTGVIYYFVITELQKKGIKMLFIGGSPPILTNGLLFFKMKLLAQIDHEKPYQPAGCVSLHVLKFTEGVRDFLKTNPFVFIKNDGKMAAAVWTFSGKGSGAEVLEHQINQAFRLGLDECHVFARRKNLIPKSWYSQFKDKKVLIHQVAGWFNSWF